MAGKGRNRKYLVLVCGVIVVVAWAAASWWRAINTVPAVEIPKPKMPRPNAYDYYAGAGQAVRRGGEIQLAVAVPGESPAAKGTPERTYSLAEKEALVKANAVALATLRQGFRHRCLAPPSRSLADTFPEYRGFRRLAMLLVLEGQVKEARGDWGGASESYMDAIRMGGDVMRGAVLIGRCVGAACQSLGRRRMWSLMGHLDAKQARAAAKRMEDIIARRVPPADTLQEEKWFGQAALMEMFDGKLEDKTAKVVARMPNYLKRRAILIYTRQMDRAIADVQLPYPKSTVKTIDFAPSRNPLTRPADTLAAMVLPVYQGPFPFACRDVQDALLTVSLALRAYRLEHGRYPDSLAALVPRYLRSVPSDPFAMRGPLGYRRAGDRYVLYSVGPDCKDNGGKPIDDPNWRNRIEPPGAPPPPPGQAGYSTAYKPRGDERYQVWQDSKGDIVAGVNIR